MGINDDKNILEIDAEVLLDFGAMQDVLLEKGQIYRLLTASLLHMNLLHIAMNLVIYVFLLSRLEKIYHFKYLFMLVILSAISGIILFFIYR